MATRKTYHVTQSPKGGWQVKSEGAKRAIAHTDTKSGAVSKATNTAKNADLGQVVIHGKDGKIQTEHTYGKDPYPPKG